MRDECESRYLEEEEAVGRYIGDQVTWMKISGMVPQASDAAIPHDLAPRIDPDVNWVENGVTPYGLIKKQNII